MSRGFVKEEDQEEAPIIPPRAALPAGVTNYVTPVGMEELLEEKKQLEQERAALDPENEMERRRAQAVIDGNVNLLNERINSARIIQPKEQAQDEVRFGAVVEFMDLEKKFTQKFQIVGVDEADIKKQKIAFVAPIARALTGKKAGETAEFKMGTASRKLKILTINYN
ncbi:GreA/GreB family elongation factor [Salegentibacter sp. F188]|uniref:GreA/GreB family elongation factor n=1 Tax=Autumnicola patrickiae TaxID=3075591 RepID=A0ABU3E2G2_9FLAO|nr:GreA/GreB family elongation factor [Salegentibacter sp. F188]MDT0690122.1 GreA/GreB family elongation factor [Salegentibacter sp. F188]